MKMRMLFITILDHGTLELGKYSYQLVQFETNKNYFIGYCFLQTNNR